MIKEFSTYTIICDNCGADICNGTDYSGYGDADYVNDMALDNEWIEVDKKHYCDNCFSYDDNDELVIDKSRTK